MGDMLQEKTWSHCLSIPAVDNSKTYTLASSAASDTFDCNKMLACICRTAAISAPLQACKSILSTSVTVQQLCERPDCPLTDCNDEEYPAPGLPACDLLSPLTSCCDPCPPKPTQGTAEPKQHHHARYQFFKALIKQFRNLPFEEWLKRTHPACDALPGGRRAVLKQAQLFISSVQNARDV